MSVSWLENGSSRGGWLGNVSSDGRRQGEALGASRRAGLAPRSGSYADRCALHAGVVLLEHLQRVLHAPRGNRPSGEMPSRTPAGRSAPEPNGEPAASSAVAVCPQCRAIGKGDDPDIPQIPAPGLHVIPARLAPFTRCQERGATSLAGRCAQAKPRGAAGARSPRAATAPGARGCFAPQANAPAAARARSLKDEDSPGRTASTGGRRQALKSMAR